MKSKLLIVVFIAILLYSTQVVPLISYCQPIPPKPPENVPTFAPTPEPTSSPSPSPAPEATEAPWIYPTNQPTKIPIVKSGGFWSPLTIGIVAAALVAFSVSAALFYVRRGKRKMLFDEERRFNTQEPPATSNRSAVISRYNQSYQSSYQSQQPARPTQTSRYRQPSSYSHSPQSSSSSVTTPSTQSSSYSQPAPYTKICSHCKRTVRDDQNICPYCDKRLK